MSQTKPSNMEAIIKEVKKLCKVVIKMQKLDGITIECYVPKDVDINKGTTEIKNICRDLKLLPINIEKSEEKSNAFALQFPELDVIYNKSTNKKMVLDAYKWLLDTMIRNSTQKAITKQLLFTYKDTVIKRAMDIYYRANVNRYKVIDKDFKQLIEENKKQLNVLYYEFLEDYEVKEL